MFDTNSEKLDHVGCSVESCTYNSEGKHCTADHIHVLNDQAHKMDETFCGTFTKRKMC